MPRWRSQKATIGLRSATQNAMWSRVLGSIRLTLATVPRLPTGETGTPGLRLKRSPSVTGV
jgi:hypothetical protein